MKRFAGSNPDIEKTMDSHLIGNLRRLLGWSDDYDSFIKNRADRVSAELSKRIIDRAVDKDGQIMIEEDVIQD